MPGLTANTHIVAVDGPAAAGKTTTSLIIAKRYGLKYLESGRAYRLMAYLALCNGVRLDNESALVALYRSVFGNQATASMVFEETERHGDSLRSPDVTRAVSKVSGMPALRTRITELIRSWAASASGGVVEGRDIGTTVFPRAAVKFFLTAAPDVRAQRRAADEVGRAYQDVLADVLRRDDADRNRTASPLRPAQDSIVIDTSHLSVDAVVTMMAHRCDEVGFATVHGA